MDEDEGVVNRKKRKSAAKKKEEKKFLIGEDILSKLEGISPSSTIHSWAC